MGSGTSTCLCISSNSLPVEKKVCVILVCHIPIFLKCSPVRFLLFQLQIRRTVSCSEKSFPSDFLGFTTEALNERCLTKVPVKWPTFVEYCYSCCFLFTKQNILGLQAVPGFKRNVSHKPNIAFFCRSLEFCQANEIYGRRISSAISQWWLHRVQINGRPSS